MSRMDCEILSVSAAWRQVFRPIVPLMLARARSSCAQVLDRSGPASREPLGALSVEEGGCDALAHLGVDSDGTLEVAIESAELAIDLLQRCGNELRMSAQQHAPKVLGHGKQRMIGIGKHELRALA